MIFYRYPKGNRIIIVASPLFDPFNSRLARDIRNSLSKAFLQALAENDAAIFQRCGADFLQQNREPGHESYITTRLGKYEKAYAIIEQRKLREGLQLAEIFWDFGLYFEMHELLELEWKDATGDRRKALQGLIRAVGMKIHAENNNMKAAASMGAKAMLDLMEYGSELTGFVKRDAILTEIKRILAITEKSHSGD
jgi:hypothetical protein